MKSDLFFFKELQELKSSFSTITEFMKFVTNESYTFEIICHKETNNKLTRTSTFSFQSQTLVMGYLKINLETLPDNFLMEWRNSQLPLGGFCKEKYNFSRESLFEHNEEESLTSLSQLHINNKAIGLCWEIFDTHFIMQLLNLHK